MIKKITIVFLVLVASVCSLVGCSIEKSKSLDKTYNMDSAVDAAAYCSFLNKQIDATTNQLSSNMLIAKKVVNNKYPIPDALSTAKQSLGIISSAKEEVEIMIPPKQYKDSRDNVLRVMTNAENDLETYIEELEKENCDYEKIKSLASIMQGDFTALTAEFNIYYE